MININPAERKKEVQKHLLFVKMTKIVFRNRLYNWEGIFPHGNRSIQISTTQQNREMIKFIKLGCIFLNHLIFFFPISDFHLSFPESLLNE